MKLSLALLALTLTTTASAQTTLVTGNQAPAPLPTGPVGDPLLDSDIQGITTGLKDTDPCVIQCMAANINSDPGASAYGYSLNKLCTSTDFETAVKDCMATQCADKPTSLFDDVCSGGFGLGAPATGSVAASAMSAGSSVWAEVASSASAAKSTSSGNGVMGTPPTTGGSGGPNSAAGVLLPHATAACATACLVIGLLL